MRADNRPLLAKSQRELHELPLVAFSNRWRLNGDNLDVMLAALRQEQESLEPLRLKPVTIQHADSREASF